MGANHDFKVSLENYLKTIWTIEQKKGHAVTNKDLSLFLEISKPSVTQMVQKLVKSGLVKKEDGGRGFRLTAKGADHALHLLRAHRVVEMFLNVTLKIDGLFLHLEAERLEHAVSDKLIDEMDRFLGFPNFDFSGAPIPRLSKDEKKNKYLSEFQNQDSGGVRLSDLNEGPCEVVRIHDDSHNLLKQVENFKIRVGDRLNIQKRDPASKEVFLKHKSRLIRLSAKEASSIVVKFCLR